MADFQFYLNRQGARGPQGYKGDKGDDGKTPVPRTGTNTPIETTVIFDTGDGNPYETPNLKYPIEDRGGNVVMLDRTNNTQYYGAPDQATDDSYGVVKLATPESVLDDPLNSDVVTYELFDNNNQTIKATTDSLAGDITQLNTDLGAEITNRTNADTQLSNKINTDIGNEAIARNNADTALSGRIDGLNISKANKSDVYTKTQTDSLLNNKSNVGHTHNYNEITNKPDIGNGTITITQGGVVKGSFTTNQLSNGTIALDAGGGGGGGSSYTPGDGINITNDVISAKVDNDSIYVNQNGELVANLEDITEALGAILDGDASIFDDYYTKTQSDSRYVQGSTLATVATSGSYNDLADKPTIPSVGNAEIEIQKNGTKVDSFTTNQSGSKKTINITVPINNNQLTNGAGYITNAELPTKLSDLTDDLGTSPVHTHSQYLTEHQDISGKANTADLATVATSGNYNDLLNKPTIQSTANMVTTDTNQTITGQKAFDSEYTFVNTDKTLRIGSDGASHHIDLVANSYNSVPRLSIYTSQSGHNYGLELSNQMYDSKYRFWFRQPNGSTSYYDSKIYKSNSANARFRSSDLNNFLLEKDMIDGTYLIWDSANNKITVDIQAIKDAIDALSNSSGTAA